MLAVDGLVDSETYRGLSYMLDPNLPHLGGSIAGGDPYTYCPATWRYVLDRFCIRSVLDLGSGCGNASWWFHKHGCQVLAVDGLVDSAGSAAYPTLAHDNTRGPVCTRVDLVYCHEVVEHIEEQYLDHLLRSLMCGRYILMTHAIPGQPGYHHVNCQHPEYWLEHLGKRNCTLLLADTQRIRALAEKENSPYIASTGLMLVNNCMAADSLSRDSEPPNARDSTWVFTASKRVEPRRSSSTPASSEP